MLMRGCSALFVLLLCLDAARAAVSPTPLQVPDSAAPTFVSYTARDGLSDEIWSAMGIDKHGFVWAGSASQLARFDGTRWELQDQPRADGGFSVIAAEDRHEFWLAGRDGLIRLQGMKWLDAEQIQIPNQHVVHLQETRTLFGERRQWVGTADDGLWYRVLLPSPGPWSPRTMRPT